ncbi:hypothetical protein EPUS_00018 [Endocarpon pusillum Z07020]|uniref:Guanine nucleotide exchange factor n=1 Tax=Endocarpon pusillum (strain Z07020 / HMAS-L-300199) TaxID=1263415 RepID=U1GT93_ENDPU|nr:uncharacterized protein EPUS_00018 [Endocarpon pusillum Z07020]ERF75226.1 hypothetical protein EPUS_00018 [Endocarpon pusillum Z07020]
MGLPPSPDSDTSLVSLDPAIVRQISRSKSSHQQLSAKAKQPFPILASEQHMHESHNTIQYEPLHGKPPRKIFEKTRKNSLRRVKDSTEVLRQKSTSARHVANTSDGTSATASKGGRHFTVGNVGTGGKLYLRPTATQPQQATPKAFVFPSPTPNSTLHGSLRQENAISGLRQSIWSDSQISDKAPNPTAARSPPLRSKMSDGPPRPSAHIRPFSFSTVDVTHQPSAEPKDGVLRIVIDRSATTRPKTTEKFALPTLEIPIPHYRLGNPHFSIQGTPLLRSSAYTKTSGGVSENLKPASILKTNFLSPERKEEGPSALSKSQTFDTLLSCSGTTSDLSKDPAGAAVSSTSHSQGEPIDPKVYDRLTSIKDEPCVVRYSQRTGAITAATPARIVAQISSEAFMDYDLVSDFFLTFRAYLSTERLLSLLLARLHWAINRLEDDGRVIRIRTFAALRHWILNYFVDDFVVNRKLRVQFCDQINEMYHEVSRRTGGGVSDMKILLDLKRCWNGRCSLYWDSRDFVVTQQDADIVPGGIMGSRDASLTQLDIALDQEIGMTPDNYQDKVSVTKSWYGSPPVTQGSKTHDKHPFTFTAGWPTSPTSEQSLQPKSCSIPARAFKRTPPPESSARRPYPVSLYQRMQKSPFNLPTSMEDSQRRLSNAHKRSCSTSDSIRDQGSANFVSQPVYLASPYAGSLIRGNVYPPAAPFVDVIVPESPPSHKPRLNASPIGMSTAFDSSAKSGSPTNPGMKTLMGSIRRALSSKQTGSNSTSSTEEIGPLPPSLHGKTSNLPLNLARSTDTLREKKSALASRHHLRIDLLCAAVSQSYQMVQAKASEESVVNHGLGVSISGIHESSGSQQTLGSRDFSIEAGDIQGIPGQDAVRSASSVLDNTTGNDLPRTITAFGRDMQGEALVTDLEFAAAGMASTPILSTERSTHQRRSSLEDRRRSSSVDTALARRSREQGKMRVARSAGQPSRIEAYTRRTSSSEPSERLRAAVSPSALLHTDQRQSHALPHGPYPNFDASVASSAMKQSKLEFQSQGHTLRRRPGGNLRNIENVHDLAAGPRRQSTGSLTTQSESVGSMLVMGGHKVTMSKQKKPALQVAQHPISLIRTHSSQHLRPSFEAAISGFSAIPDDADGGLEATLLKLEGRYKHASPEIGIEMGAECARDQTAMVGSSSTDPRQNFDGNASYPQGVQAPISTRGSNPRLRQPASASRTRKPGIKTVSARFGQPKSSVADSEESYSSIPLLERGLVGDAVKKPNAHSKSAPTVSIPSPLLEGQVIVETQRDVASPHPSIELVEKTESMGRIPHGSTLPDVRPLTANGSFLLDEDDNLTDLSSEMTVDVIEHSEVQAPIVSSPAGAPGNVTSGHPLPTHPLAHPPSPAFSIHQAVTPVPPVNPMMYQQKPLTPQPSPTQGVVAHDSQRSLSQILPPRKSPAVASATVTTSAGHIPFVLACESVVLAQQLTLVEKAALSEIEWSDLVDMKWDNKSPNILNWVEYLAAKDNRGIDIVITRFNLVVKWVLSEIVMTQNIYERAQAITKYIHIAGHAKRIHNYATMLQITIALTSIDCTRLKATWELVSESDQVLLREMETLIQPIRNFHDLRIEMETANLQDGCIPFVGLYVHDLTYNAQKPSQIANSLGGEPLVNFEKYRTIATIVKSLLRLIDASSKYNFAPIPGIIERCLWMAALSDEKITALSKSIEQ